MIHSSFSFLLPLLFLIPDSPPGRGLFLFLPSRLPAACALRATASIALYIEIIQHTRESHQHVTVIWSASYFFHWEVYCWISCPGGFQVPSARKQVFARRVLALAHTGAGDRR
jgi:hypothetical protein